MRNILKLAAWGAALGLLASCGDSVEALTGSVTPPLDPAGRVEFSQVQPILREKCAICHNEYSDSAKIVKKAKQIAATIEGYYMPAPGVAQLAPEDRITLLAWLHQEEN